MQIVHNGTCTMYCNLLEDIRIAKAAGYDGIEIIGSKLCRFLDQGYTLDAVKRALDGFPVVALGYVQDIERQGDGRTDLMDDAERMCAWAKELGAGFVQVLTGPIGPGIGEDDGYRGLEGCSEDEALERTAVNLRDLGGIAARHDLNLYLESLAWTQLGALPSVIRLLEAADCTNVLTIIDFWHLWIAGTEAGDIARLDSRHIAGVHVCDSLPRPTSGPIMHSLREVWTGAGHIPLQDWVDAVLATGFDGWWSCELFAPQYWERDPQEVARRLREHLEFMLPLQNPRNEGE